jgi:hypothetical protein
VVRDAIAVSRAYLEGAGDVRTVKRLLLPDRRLLILDVDGERAVLNHES